VSKQRAKGTAFETLIVRYLNEHGFPHAERRALHGTHDLGDITGTPGIVWECKNHKQIRLAEWLTETETETSNANAEIGVLVAKRPGRGQPEEQYAIVTLETMTRLLKAAGW
jgi:hypothetical protein